MGPKGMVVGVAWVSLAASAVPPVPQPQLRTFLQRLEGIPGALAEQRPHLQRDRSRLAAQDWARLAPDFLAALPDPDGAKRLGAELDRGSGIEAAGAALALHHALLPLLQRERDRIQAQTSQELLSAWLRAEALQWAALPDLDPTLQRLLTAFPVEGKKLQPLVREHLRKYDAARQSRDRSLVQLQVTLLRRLADELLERS